MSLLEIGILAGDGRLKLNRGLAELFDSLQANPVIRILPLTYEIATDAGLLGRLRDPADRAIVATARAHRLTLLTSDQRITDSKLVAVVP
jgi:PIN domain nuclease of toxin-antitoxin system